MASAYRVEAEDVEALTGDAPSSVDVDVFIAAGHSLVEAKLVGEGLTAIQLIEIERWLSAHFLACHPEMRQHTEEDMGQARDKYGGQFNMNLSFTQYGQMALTLDTSGKLEEASKRSIIFKDLTP